jgi:polyribonucleotide nucleotidyltransferase
MIECAANEVPEDILNQAFEIGQQEINASCDYQTAFLKKLNVQKLEIVYNKPSEELIAYVSQILNHDKLDALAGNTKVPFNTLFSEYEKEVLSLAKEHIGDSANEDFTESKVKMAVFNVIKHFIRHRTLDTGKRIDDRGIKDIRPLYTEVGVLPRVHGA